MMSFTPGPYWRQQEGEAAELQDSFDQARERRALLDQGNGDAPTPRRRLGDHLRRMLSRDAPPAGSEESDLTADQVWERERQRRLEYEQDRSNKGD